MDRKQLGQENLGAPVMATFDALVDTEDAKKRGPQFVDDGTEPNKESSDQTAKVTGRLEERFFPAGVLKDF